MNCDGQYISCYRAEIGGQADLSRKASAVANQLMVNRFGLTEVSRPTSAKTSVDIVFVHGLNGDPQKTWTSENTKVFWPAQLLPPILEDQNARILVYGYDADVVSFTDGASKDMIHNHAERLVADLFANRRVCTFKS